MGRRGDGDSGGGGGGDSGGGGRRGPGAAAQLANVRLEKKGFGAAAAAPPAPWEFARLYYDAATRLKKLYIRDLKDEELFQQRKGDLVSVLGAAAKAKAAAEGGKPIGSTEVRGPPQGRICVRCLCLQLALIGAPGGGHACAQLHSCKPLHAMPRHALQADKAAAVEAEHAKRAQRMVDAAC